MFRLLSLSAVIVCFFVLTAEVVFAGFGVTPPYVRNTSLTRNSNYEQQILIVRGDPTVPLKASVLVDAPGFSDWIEIVEGTEFTLPRGEQKVPMTVRVRIPDDAEFKNYTGSIRIKTGAVDDQVSAGAVNISLGAQIDLELNVIDKVIEDFKVRKIGISDLNEGTKIGWLDFPGKINFSIVIENTGNVDVAPSKVVFRIYDASGSVLLEETKNKGKIQKVKPFAVEEVVAYLPTFLPAGTYIARYQIFNGEESKLEGELNLSILPYGTLQAAGFGFSGLSLMDKFSVMMPIGALVIILLLFIISRRRNRVH
jgi:hypothetical protein